MKDVKPAILTKEEEELLWQREIPEADGLRKLTAYAQFIKEKFHIDIQLKCEIGKSVDGCYIEYWFYTLTHYMYDKPFIESMVWYPTKRQALKAAVTRALHYSDN